MTTELTGLLQIRYVLMLNSQVIFKSILVPERQA